MKGIYFDNAATSFPKAPGVVENMADYLTFVGANINRGAYGSSYEAGRTVFETRELICQFFNFPKPENVVFTKNITESLNIVLKGLLREGDHIIVSSLEHNAVMRPLSTLQKKGVEVSRVPCGDNGELNPGLLDNLIKPHTKAVVMTHASNVNGTILPLEEVGTICRKHNLLFIIDSAQTAGFIELDFARLKADALAFTGHKGLLGPQGIGGLLLTEELASRIEPLIEGGTGSLSESENQPPYLPDKFESGTMNIPGIFGLNAAVKYLLEKGIDTIREHELLLTKTFLQGVMNIPGLKLVGLPDTTGRTALVSLDFINLDNAAVADMLYKHFNIMTRCGLHCAPSAHLALRTFPQGTVRFSFSSFNTLKEIEYCLDSINKCLKMT